MFWVSLRVVSSGLLGLDTCCVVLLRLTGGCRLCATIAHHSLLPAVAHALVSEFRTGQDRALRLGKYIQVPFIVCHR